MESFQRTAMFMDDTVFAKAIQKLPPNLRPFGESTALEDNEESRKSPLPEPSNYYYDEYMEEYY
jgi:hypothetical protein